MTTGYQLAIDGQDAALAAATMAHSTATNELWDALHLWAFYGCTFSAEDLRAELSPELNAWIDRNHHAWSSIWGQASRAKLIEQVGWVPTVRKLRHGNPNRMWKGTLNV